MPKDKRNPSPVPQTWPVRDLLTNGTWGPPRTVTLEDYKRDIAERARVAQRQFASAAATVRP